MEGSYVAVRDLQPGDVFSMAGATATFIVATRHPWYPGLALVVWWLHAEQQFSFDALSWGQELAGQVVLVVGGRDVQRGSRERAWREATKAAQV